MKYQLKKFLPQGEVETWKVARIGFILSKESKNNLDFNHIITLLFLSFYRYVDVIFLQDQKVLGDRNKSYYNKVLYFLMNRGYVEKINTKMDDESKSLFPHPVYKLTKHGERLVKKIHKHLNGTEDFLNYN